MKEEGRSQGWGDNRHILFTIHINMITINSDISIQECHWQPLSVHLWAHCTYPTHDVWRLATPPGSESPTLFEQWCGFFYVPQEPDKCKCCETGPTVFHPYPRRLESLIVCRCHYKGRTSQLFWVPECWSGQGSNLRPPAQQISTLPTELTRRLLN